MSKISFYCPNCQLDQDLEGHITTYYGGGRKFVARCQKCGKELFRLIDEKKNDPYYFLSKRVIMERQKFRKDLLQPSDYGFRTFYKQEFKKMEKAKEELEKKDLETKRKRDEFLKSHNQNIVEKNLAKKILEQEEKLKFYE